MGKKGSVKTSAGSQSAGLTPSMDTVVSRLSNRNEVSAADIINGLLETHGGYAEDRAKKIRLEEDPNTVDQKPLGEWIGQIGSLYDPDRVKELNGRQVILGLSRFVGDDLLKQLQEDDFLELLKKEHEPDYNSLLSDLGKEKWRIKEPSVGMDDFQSDRTYLNIDHPSAEDRLGRKPFADALALYLRYLRHEITNPSQTQSSKSKEEKKAGLSQSIWLHINKLWGSVKGTLLNFLPGKSKKKKKVEQKQSIMLHMYGPWGSGKSTLLKFLSASLQDKLNAKEYRGFNTQKWIVVEFNAWQHQKIDPPWWALMDSVFRQACEQLIIRSFYLRIREYFWRFFTTTAPRFLVILILTLLLILGLILVNSNILISDNEKSQHSSAIAQKKPQLEKDSAQKKPGDLKGADRKASETPAKTDKKARYSTIFDRIKQLHVIISLVVALGGIAYAISRSLLPGTARAAQSYIEMSRNPMQQISNHFTKLMKWIKKPTAIFIDDLDRCDEKYVVELLEGIQTLFRYAQVFYVVAADIRWLRASYKEAYKVFSGSVDEPGNPLDHLFMGKIFQLSVPVPNVLPYYKENYWRHLIDREEFEEPEEEIKKIEKEAAHTLQNKTTDKDITSEVLKHKGKGLRELIYRAEAAKRYIDPKVRQTTENRLKNFEPLVGSNPRTMKRMLNSHIIQQQLAALTGIDINPDILPLWTILSMRWPLLTETLSKYPEAVKLVGKRFKTEKEKNDLINRIPEGTNELLSRQEVKDVVKGKGILGATLNQKNIRLCASLSI
jgi:hypothetical protein